MWAVRNSRTDSAYEICVSIFKRVTFENNFCLRTSRYSPESGEIQGPSCISDLHTSACSVYITSDTNHGIRSAKNKKPNPQGKTARVWVLVMPKKGRKQEKSWWQTDQQIYLLTRHFSGNYFYSLIKDISNKFFLKSHTAEEDGQTWEGCPKTQQMYLFKDYEAAWDNSNAFVH